jgi:hypothetical protein
LTRQEIDWADTQVRPSRADHLNLINLIGSGFSQARHGYGYDNGKDLQHPEEEVILAPPQQGDIAGEAKSDYQKGHY